MALIGPVYRASSFDQSIGVNTHLGSQNPGSSYANVSVVEASLAYLGVTNVRDGIPYIGWTLPEFAAIAATGVKFDIIVTTPNINIANDLLQINALETAVPGSVAAVEGANEFNTNNYVYDGVSSLNNPAWAQLFDPALYAAVKADPTLSGVNVIASSTASAGAEQVQEEGNLSAFVDSSNWHVYYGDGAQPGPNIASGAAFAKSTAPGDPVTITETGYYTAIDAMDWGGGGVSQPVQAILTVNALLDAFNDGVQTTYLYELMDDISNPSSTDLEDSFGLFEGDGTPKPAAVAVHDLTTILADPAANADTFQTGTLAASITGLPGTGNSMLLEKSSGIFDLIIWNEPTIWNEATESEVTPAASTVTVNLGGIYDTVEVYDPIVGSAPIQTLTDVSTVTLSLSADPYIIEIDPNPASQTYSPGAAGGTIDSTGADTVQVGSGAVTVVATGPTITVVGGAGALTYSGTAKATITGGTGAMHLTLSGSGSTVIGGTGGMTVVDLVGGNLIQGGPGNANNPIVVTTTQGNDTITTGTGTATNTINLGSGNDTVIANGTSTITGSTGDDTITVNGTWGTVRTGTGSSVVTMNANGSVTTNGYDSVTTNAGLTIAANGPETTLVGGAGRIRFSGDGSATITGGAGGGYFNMRSITNGVVTTAAGATDTVLFGAPGGTATLHGHDTVKLGKGAATLYALAGTSVVTAGAGRMSFIEGAATATVVAGSGADTFTLTAGHAGGSLSIKDFVPGSDVIDLVGYQPGQVTTTIVNGSTQILLSDHSLITLVGMTNSNWHPTIS